MGETNILQDAIKGKRSPNGMIIKEMIRDFISKELLHGNLGASLGDDDELVESGIIDSLGVMSLLGFLDEKFSFQISGDDLIPENFASIKAITDLVERQKKG
jgi:acyl carrier protein